MKKLLCGILCLLMLLGCASAEGYWYAAKGDNGLWGRLPGQLCVDSAGRPGRLREPRRRNCAATG